MRFHVNLPGPFSVSTRIPGTGRRRYYTTKQRPSALKALADIGRAERQRKAAAQQQAARDARLQAWYQEWKAREWHDELRRQVEARAYQQWAWNQEQRRLNQQQARMDAARAARATTPHRRGNHTHQTIGGVTWKTPSPNSPAPSAAPYSPPAAPSRPSAHPNAPTYGTTANVAARPQNRLANGARTIPNAPMPQPAPTVNLTAPRRPLA